MSKLTQQESAYIGRIVKIVMVLLILGIGGCFQPFTYENIDAGSVGIKINLYGTDKGVDDITLVTGRVWYNEWTTKVVEVPAYTQTVSYKDFIVTAKDNTEFSINPKLTFSIDQKLVPYMYRKYRKPLDELKGTVLRNVTLNSYITIANKYSSDSLMSNRERFEIEVEREFNKKLASEGFIEADLVSGLVPPARMKEQIDRKNESIQARMAAENEAKQAIAEAQVTKAKAEGEATAMIVKARAEAESNRLRQQTLSDNLIKKMWIDKWDGSLPTTNAGGSNLMIGIK